MNTPSAVLTVREATPADVPALVDLMQEFYAESGFSLERDWAAQVFQSLLAAPERGVVWVALANQTPIGHAVLSLRFTMEYGGLCGYIDDLFVKPEFRRLGGARRLIAQLRHHCQRLGCRALHVEVGEPTSPRSRYTSSLACVYCAMVGC